MFLYKCWRERSVRSVWGKLPTPLYLPPKNPIKREKKKLVCSSEREDFIKRGEDWFVRLLRVL